jgi:hypothetical protein
MLNSGLLNWRSADFILISNTSWRIQFRNPHPRHLNRPFTDPPRRRTSIQHGSPSHVSRTNDGEHYRLRVPSGKDTTGNGGQSRDISLPARVERDLHRYQTREDIALYLTTLLLIVTPVQHYMNAVSRVLVTLVLVVALGGVAAPTTTAVPSAATDAPSMQIQILDSLTDLLDTIADFLHQLNRVLNEFAQLFGGEGEGGGDD